MTLTVLDIEPAHAADLGLAEVAADGRTLCRLGGGHLFSVRPGDRPRESDDERRAYVVLLGRESDRGLLPQLLEACERAGRPTATVAAGEEEYAALGAVATLRWEPAPLLPAPAATLARHAVAAAVAVTDELDPHLVVLDLVSGWQELGHLVHHLRRTGRWGRSVVVAVTDPERDLGLVSRWLGADL